MYNFEKGGWWSGDKAVSRVQGGVHEGVGGGNVFNKQMS